MAAGGKAGPVVHSECRETAPALAAQHINIIDLPQQQAVPPTASTCALEGFVDEPEAGGRDLSDILEHDAEAADSWQGASGSEQRSRFRLGKRRLAGLACVVLMLPALFVVFTRPLPNATVASGTPSTSSVRQEGGRDCIAFHDYSQGDVVESDYGIGIQDFTFMAWLAPRALTYGMILSRDRAGDAINMFRVEMYVDGRLGIIAGGFSEKEEEFLEYPNARDHNGWGSRFTSSEPLVLDKEVHFCVVRRGLEWAMFIDGEHAVPDGWREQRSRAIMDLNEGTDKILRVGSRFPSLPTFLSPSARSTMDPLAGTIRDAALHVGVALAQEQVRAGNSSCR
jgi:hypothetical protein